MYLVDRIKRLTLPVVAGAIVCGGIVAGLCGDYSRYAEMQRISPQIELDMIRGSIKNYNDLSEDIRSKVDNKDKEAKNMYILALAMVGSGIGLGIRELVQRSNDKKGSDT